MKGVDFGRYTEFGGSQTSNIPIDFVIAGITSGDHFTERGLKNIDVLKDEPVLMLYHFYEFGVNWVPQVDIAIEAMKITGAKAIWWDYESTGNPMGGNYRLRHSIKRTALESHEAVKALKEEFDNRVGWYLNFADYVRCKKYISQSLLETALWIAFPHRSKQYPRPGFVSPDKYWPQTGRPKDDWLIHQYSWIGPSVDYGVLNHKAKKGIDLNFAKPNLLEWLDIDNQPEPPPATNENETFNRAIDTFTNKLIGEFPGWVDTIGEDLKNE